jgi:hypothetical protein
MVLADFVHAWIPTRLGLAMRLIPYVAFTLHTHEAPEQLVHRLGPRVAPLGTAWFIPVFGDDPRFFAGTIDRRGFFLWRIPHELGRRSTAGGYGYFTANAEGTTVRIQIRMSWLAILFVIGLWYPLVMFCIVGMLITTPLTSTDIVVRVFVSVGLLLGPWLITAVSFWPHVPAYRAEIERMLSTA